MSSADSDRTPGEDATLPFGQQDAGTAGLPAAGLGARYRILRPHAAGGLGEVFVAEDLELHREVALKKIRPQHVNEESSQGRFVQEAQITGGLEHPGIVPVYGLGIYADGRPYYAMRFVHGDNLKAATEHFHRRHGITSAAGDATADATERGAAAFRSLEFRQLLGRFVDVCHAIAYAHSRGVLHRDLKPGNIMLGKFGETLVVDWGLAKVVGQAEANAGGPEADRHASGGVEATSQGSAVGTPAFMSPEQAAGDMTQIGPATDIYSLGATLYVVLTNRPPVSGHDMSDVLDRARRGEWQSPQQVNPSIPAALDAICRKAMAKSPQDRYGSALELANDIERWLGDEPVSIYAEPVADQIRRWGRKNPGPATGVAVAVLVGIIGLGLSSLLLSQKNQQLSAANRRITQEAKRTKIAQRQAEAVNQFLTDELLGQADPDKNPYQEQLTVVDLLNRSAERIAANQALRDQPEVEAVIRSTIGRTLRALGKYSAAKPHLERAVALGESSDGARDEATLEALLSLAELYANSDELIAARQTIDRMHAAGVPRFEPSQPLPLKVRLLAASVAARLGEYEEAEAAARFVLSRATEALGDDHPVTIEARETVADILSMQFKGFDEARSLYEANLASLKRQGLAEHSHAVLSVTMRLCEQLEAQGRMEEAEQQLENVLATRVELTLPEAHHDTLVARTSLGVLQTKIGKLDAAAENLRRAYALARAEYGPNHTVTWLSRRAYGIFVSRCAPFVADPDFMHERAVSLARENVDLARQQGWELPHANRAQSENDLALALVARATADPLQIGTLDEAEQILRNLLRVCLDTQGTDNVNTISAAMHLAQLLAVKPGGRAEGEALCREWLDRSHRVAPKGWPMYAYGCNTLGNLLIGRRALSEAEPYFRDYFDFCRSSPRATRQDAYAATQFYGADLAVQFKGTALHQMLFEEKTTYRLHLTTDARFRLTAHYPILHLFDLTGLVLNDVTLPNVVREQVAGNNCHLFYTPAVAQTLFIHGTALAERVEGLPCRLEIATCKPQTTLAMGELTEDDPIDTLMPETRRDIIPLPMKAGVLYRIRATSSDFDPFLRLNDGQGRTVLADNDSGNEHAAQIEFLADADEAFQVIVASAEPQSLGAYKVEITAYAPDGEPQVVEGKLGI